VTGQAQTIPYRDASVPVEERVADLLGRMTLEEKVAQLICLWDGNPQAGPVNGHTGDRGELSFEKARVALKDGIGQIGRQRERKGPRESALFANELQRFLVEHTRLGIPAIFHDETLHGHMAKGGTSFPQPLALACAWDEDLVRRVFSAAALEARARGGQLALGPNLDVGRDPRWGRTDETFGEDPHLVSRLGVACIEAMQGPGPGIDGSHVMATAKHFAAHGQPEGGTNAAPASFSERDIREVFFPSFRAAVTEARVCSVMASYNEIGGIPSHANGWLLGEVLRKEWGFDGLVVADYYGISQLQSLHHVAADRAEAAAKALLAGVDIELPDPECYPLLVGLVREGRVPESAVDQAVARNLTAKFRLGLFEHPYVDPDRATAVTNSRDHRAIAAQAARESIVLLKNDGSLLPFDRSRLKRIAVIGPNADRAHLGGYSDDPGNSVSVLQGVRGKVGSGVEVLFAEGCRITRAGGDWWANWSELSDPAEDEKLIAEAVETANAADVALLVLGGNEDTNREAWSPNHLGDRDSLDLVGRQNDLVKAVLATGKPTVVLLISGGPLSANYIAENVPAILQGFYLGQETGTGVADVLFGDYNPSGKLPISVPRSVGQLPLYYNHKPSAKRGYLFTSKEPLFPFGFGLSYTTFAYSDLRVFPARITPDGQTSVSVTVKNTGARAGDEVVQLYIHDLVSSVTRPVLELKDFRRLSLAPGESRAVTFNITADKLAFLGPDMQPVVEPGTFDILVGPSSVNFQTVQLEVVNP